MVTGVGVCAETDVAELVGVEEIATVAVEVWVTV